MLQTAADHALGTIAEMRAALLARSLSPVELIEAVLARIATDEPRLNAWVEIDAEGALAAARGVDVESQPLAGIPFGVKDVIDVKGLTTRFGTDWDGFAPAGFDAWCVAAMRAAGAIPIGKVRTTPFALSDPTTTRNPWDLTRSPGGSSSGSGAAVGARQVPFAFGTQTGGSTLRPAAFCGVVGFKATVGAIPTAGVSQLGPTADCVGILCRTAADASTLLGIFDASAGAERVTAPRISTLRGFFDDVAGATVRGTLDDALATLSGAGAVVVKRSIPAAVDDVERAWGVMGAYEAYAALGQTMRGRSAGPRIDELVAKGAKTSYAAYRSEQKKRLAGRAEVDAFLAECDVLALPSAGAVPLFGTTGSPVFLRPWTFYGYPAISLPIGFDGDGMPIGMQLVGSRGGEASLLAVARWVEETLAFENPGPRSRLESSAAAQP